MKIAIIMQHFKIHGGNEMLAYSLIEGLNQRSVVPDVFTRVNKPGEEKDMEQEIVQRFHKKIMFNKKTFWIDKVAIIPNRFKKNIGLAIAVELAIRRKYDFIFDFQEGPIYFFNKGRYLKYCNAFSYDVFSLKRSRSAMNWIISQILKKPLLSRYKRGFFEARFHRVINSRYSMERALDLFGVEIPVLYPGVNIGFFKTAYKGPRSGVVSFGRFADYKRQMEMVKIAEEIERSGRKIMFHLGGGTESFEGYYRRIADYVKEKGIRNVKLHANIPIEKFKKIMEKSLIYLHGMENEPFGITTAEAIACGLIRGRDDSGGQREIVPIKELRYSNDKEAKDIIVRLSENKALCDRYRKRLLEHVKRFDEKRYQEEMMSHIKWNT